MAKTLEKRMTVAEFLDWVEHQPKGRYELVRGEVVTMQSEQARHALTKMKIANILATAVESTNLDCTVFPDGMTVVIDNETAREPNSVVQCGHPVDLDSLTVDHPLIVVEVLSPGSEKTDRNDKLVDYFAIASISHYLIIDAHRRFVIHHRRTDGPDLATRILHDGTITLTPPGLEVQVEGLFIEE